MSDWFNAVKTTETESQPKNYHNVASKPEFHSRRSSVLSVQGSVATSQPLASSIGLQILSQHDGNAADAAIAIAAALAVLEPCSTGLGGDAFALYYDSSKREVSALNGSGRSPLNLTLDELRRAHPGQIDGKKVNDRAFQRSAHAVTVPGAARAWEDFYNKYGSGRLTFSELLEPAARLAENGFPVGPITSHHWAEGIESCVKKWHNCLDMKTIPLTVDGIRGPKPGEMIYNPDMARVLRELGTHGATKGFYEGWVGRAIVDAIQKCGGVMTMDDLKEHTTSTFPKPIYTTYRDVKMWQVPPNGQGIAGLIALSGYDYLVKECKMPLKKNSQKLHTMIELMRLGFADARAFICDPDVSYTSNTEGESHDNKRKKSVRWLLDKERIKKRIKSVFNPEKAVIQGIPDPTSCTVSFQVVDKSGNAVSFVNSNFMGFGTGIVPYGCGFTLQNRGYGFEIQDDKHPNIIAPRKRPYHTIIPGILTHHNESNDLFATFSNMGGFMQPQGHFQIAIQMIDTLENEKDNLKSDLAILDPQEIIDLPRFCIADGTSNGKVFIEEGFDTSTLNDLKDMGHDLCTDISGHSRSLFGKAQIIKRDKNTGVLWAGSDGRADGCAMGF